MNEYPIKKYNMLMPVKWVRRATNGSGNAMWLFQCDCGNTVVDSYSAVKCGKRLSCGCFGRKQAKTNNLIHGKHGSRIYRIWMGMRQRCLNPKHDAYHRYGGQGIKICKRWMRFQNFYKDMGDPPGLHLTLDRINNKKGYSKSNCRWATKAEQNRNSRANIKVTFRGKNKLLVEWAEQFNIPYRLAWCRYVKQKWSIERTLTEKLHTHKSHKRMHG